VKNDHQDAIRPVTLSREAGVKKEIWQRARWVEAVSATVNWRGYLETSGYVRSQARSGTPVFPILSTNSGNPGGPTGSSKPAGRHEFFGFDSRRQWL
jgi:hypothetical protein